MAFQLLIIAGPDKDKVFTLQGGPDQMLGRGNQCLYRLTDGRASRSHCQILLKGDEVTVIDNGGSGGVKINDNVVSRKAMKLGDVLQLGDTQLRLQMGDFSPDVVQAAAAKTPGRAKDAAPPPGAAGLAALSGQKLSHFDIGAVIGEGSSSMVFRAKDTKSGEDVALKVLLPEFSKDEQEMQRFIRAMKTMLPLRHPNLITLLAAGKSGPYCWVSMEYVDGESLTQVIERIGVAGMLDWREAFRVAVQIARVLDYAQEHQIIHRNISPKNILRRKEDKVAKLGDLMLAKALEGTLAEQITRPGALVGSLDYMSPERTREGGDVDGRSDIYSLGATVYALLTGRPPFPGTSLAEKVTKIRQAEPPKPTKYQMATPHRFESIVLKMMAKEPDNRYQTPAQLVKDLEQIGRLEGVTDR